MQTYDLLMIGVLAAATLFGFWKGMAWQIASLASLFVSYVASLQLSTQFAPFFAKTFNLQPPLDRFAAMLAIYVGASFVIWTLFRLISGAIDKVRLQSFDKQIGAMFGFAKGVLLCVVITFFAVTILPQDQGQAIANSQSGRYIVALLDKSHSVFPPEVHQVVDPYLDKIEQRLNPNYQPHAGEQGTWPMQATATQPAPSSQPSGAWPSMNINIPQAIQSQFPQIPWPSTGNPPATQQPAPRAEYDPYNTPREPAPFPYSAEAQRGRDY